MKTINVDLATGEALNLHVGQQGENAVTQVVFDFSALKTEFGTGTLSLSVQRPKEPTPYAQTITTDGTDATWTVTETDTGVAGCGEIQLTYTVNSKVAKTVVYRYTVYPSIGADGEYPIPGQTWQEEMEAEIADIKQDLQSLIDGGSGITSQQWNDIISLFRGALYDTTILPNPKAVIDDLEDSIDRIPATSMTLSTNSLSFTTGTAQTVTVTLSPSNSTDSITAISGDSSVATVAVNNRTVSVTPVANGSTTITISTGSGLTATVSVSVALPQLFTVTNTLTGCTSNNSATSIYQGEMYNAVLTADTDYTINSVSVMMGSTDVTSTAWDSSTGEISIASVSGNISITATATTPILYALPQPFVAGGGAYINTRLPLLASNSSWTIAGYLLFEDDFPTLKSNAGANGTILFAGDMSQNYKVINMQNSTYAIDGGGGNTPAKYNDRQNVKFAITHEANSLDTYFVHKYFDQEDSSATNRKSSATRTLDSFIATEKPLYIGLREDGYVPGYGFTLQEFKVFNYVWSSTDIDNYVDTEEARL